MFVDMTKPHPVCLDDEEEEPHAPECCLQRMYDSTASVWMTTCCIQCMDDYELQRMDDYKLQRMDDRTGSV